MTNEDVCQSDGMTSSGIDYGKCLLPLAAHEGKCPQCGGYGEYEGEYGPRACMGCLTGLGPYGHDFTPATDAPEAQNTTRTAPPNPVSASSMDSAIEVKQ